jgi:pilus assembly protein Flp/PilA
MLKHLVRLQTLVSDALESEKGQGLAEYALILSLIAIVAVVALTFLGGRVTRELSTIATSL